MQLLQPPPSLDHARSVRTLLNVTTAEVTVMLTFGLYSRLLRSRARFTRILHASCAFFRAKKGSFCSVTAVLSALNLLHQGQFIRTEIAHVAHRTLERAHSHTSRSPLLPRLQLHLLSCLGGEGFSENPLSPRSRTPKKA